MNKSIFIPNSLFQDTIRTPEELCMYVYYGLTFSEDDSVLPFNYNVIGYHLFGRIPTRSELDKIKEATKSLVEKKIITNYRKVCNNIEEFHFEYFKFNDSEYFTEITKKDFFTVARISTNSHQANPFVIVDTYLTILLNMNASKSLDEQFRYKICNSGKESLIQKSHCSSYSFNVAIKILEEVNMISVINLVEKQKESQFNIYSRSGDLQLLEKYAQIFCSQNKDRFVGNRDIGNSQRQITCLYNRMIKKKVAYPFFIAEKVYEYVLDYDLSNLNQDKYDLSVFGDYMLELAHNYINNNVNLSSRMIFKYKDQIPKGYNDVKAAKNFLSRYDVEDLDILDEI